MALTISLTELFTIESYDGLIAYVTALLELDAESAAQVPTFIRLAEKRLKRLIITTERETTASVDASAQVVALPDECRAVRLIQIEDEGALRRVSLDYLLANYSGLTGKPEAYAFADSAVYLGPAPDDTYRLTATYMADFAPLGETNQSNWLLLDHPDAYLYATLIHANHFITKPEELASMNAALLSVVEEINRHANRLRASGPLQMRATTYA